MTGGAPIRCHHHAVDRRVADSGCGPAGTPPVAHRPTIRRHSHNAGWGSTGHPAGLTEPSFKTAKAQRAKGLEGGGRAALVVERGHLVAA